MTILKLWRFFSNKYKNIQVFNSYMSIKGHNEYVKSKFEYFKLFLKNSNDHYDVIKASLTFMICLKTVWKEGQNCSYSNRYISGTNWKFCMWFSHSVGIPVMRYDRAARPCALNFHLAALKCCFGRPANAHSSVSVWPSMPPLCASFIQNVITLTGHLFIGKKCGVSKNCHLSIDLKLFP